MLMGTPRLGTPRHASPRPVFFHTPRTPLPIPEKKKLELRDLGLRDLGLRDTHLRDLFFFSPTKDPPVPMPQKKKLEVRDLGLRDFPTLMPVTVLVYRIMLYKAQPSCYTAYLTLSVHCAYTTSSN